jgi:hypothetical protein
MVATTLAFILVSAFIVFVYLDSKINEVQGISLDHKDMTTNNALFNKRRMPIHNKPNKIDGILGYQQPTLSSEAKIKPKFAPITHKGKEEIKTIFESKDPK